MSTNYYRLKAIVKASCKTDWKNALINSAVLDTILKSYQNGELSIIETDGLLRFYNYYAYGDFRAL